MLLRTVSRGQPVSTAIAPGYGHTIAALRRVAEVRVVEEGVCRERGPLPRGCVVVVIALTIREVEGATYNVIRRYTTNNKLRYLGNAGMYLMKFGHNYTL